ncbi:MAG: hypothetical protein CMQ16_04595 [Gammaproteobacteria bacterium]|nr:hypothetical protein [Gammaproteobacteria bacterium]
MSSWKDWSDGNFNWYFLCSKLNGWIAFTGITFLSNETNTEQVAQLTLLVVYLLWVSILLFWHRWPNTLSSY